VAVQPFQLPLDSLFSSLTEPAPVRGEQASSRRRSGVGRTIIAIAATSVFFGGVGSVYMHSAMDDMSTTGSSMRTTAPAMAPGTAAMPAPAAAMPGAGADAAPPRPLGNGMPMPATAAAAAPMNSAPVDASPMASGPMASPVTASSRISSEESAASIPARSKPTSSSKSTKSSNSSAGTSVRRVTVGEGDSFSTLASRYDVSEARIAALNPGVDSTALTIGQTLRVR
jgi:LysM repeat protein